MRPLSSYYLNRQFLKLWAGQSISQLGSQVGSAAVRFTALLVLAATPAQMAWLSAAAMLPALLLGLPIGAFVDRNRRRPLLIIADLGRGLILLTLPIAYLAGWLRIELLYIIMILVGTLSILFDSAYHAFLPSVIRRDQLTDGNSRLSMSDSAAEVAGPPLGGILVQVLGAPLVVFADAISFFLSAFAIGRVQAEETRPDPEESPHVWHEIREGLALVLSDPILRTLLAASITRGLAGGLIGPLYDVFLVYDLGISPLLIGVSIGVGGVGALAGAALASRVARRFGLGRTLTGALFLTGITTALIPLASGPAAFLMLLVSQASDIGHTIYSINEVSLRQKSVPDRMLGRVGTVFNLAPMAAFLLGALATGGLVGLVGTRALLGCGAALAALAGLWLLWSPVREISSQGSEVRS
jgi:MFS family permease